MLLNPCPSLPRFVGKHHRKSYPSVPLYLQLGRFADHIQRMNTKALSFGNLISASGSKESRGPHDLNLLCGLRQPGGSGRFADRRSIGDLPIKQTSSSSRIFYVSRFPRTFHQSRLFSEGKSADDNPSCLHAPKKSPGRVFLGHLLDIYCALAPMVVEFFVLLGCSVAWVAFIVGYLKANPAWWPICVTLSMPILAAIRCTLDDFTKKR